MAVKFLINSLNGGGAETLTLQLARSLGQATVILLENIVDYSADDVAVELLVEENPARGISRYFSVPKQARELVRRVDPDDHLIVSLFRSLLVVWVAKTFYGMKATYDCWIHNDTLRYTIKPGVTYLYRQIFSGSRRVIVNSQKAASDLVEHQLTTENKLVVRYNFFDTANIQAAALEAFPTDEISPADQYVISLGRLHPSKNHNFTIRFFARLKEEYPDLQLVIVGEGEDRDDLEKLIAAEGLEDSVTLTGFVANPYPLLRSARALISCSASEGFGNVLVEALLCGTPIIATDIDSGPREILAPESADLSYRTTVPEVTRFGKLMPAVEKVTTDKELMLWVTELKSLLQLNFSEKEVQLTTSRFEKEVIIQQWKKDLHHKLTELS